MTMYYYDYDLMYNHLDKIKTLYVTKELSENYIKQKLLKFFKLNHLYKLNDDSLVLFSDYSFKDFLIFEKFLEKPKNIFEFC